MPGTIKYLRRSEIDVKKWNDCILRSENGLCYSDPSYLDLMVNNWDALVMNDYEAVMALPFRSKYGIKYLYRPTFCQQLGIISLLNNQELTDVFLKNIPSVFKYWDFSLNFLNRSFLFNTQLRKNYLLHLNKGYDSLSVEFSRNAVRNIKVALNNGIFIKEEVSPGNIIDLHLFRFGESAGMTKANELAMRKLLDDWMVKNQVYTVAALNSSGIIIASSLYLLYKKRITFILNGNLKESLETGATHLLKDHVIRKFAGTDFIIDFEGSENPYFARFYKQFGAKEIEYYPHIINNRLPWPLHLFK